MRLALVLTCIAFAAGCGSGAGTSSTASGTPETGASYYKDAKPIFDAKCVTCHYAGGIAPFSLADYASAKPYAGVIRQKVESKEMPPWLANDGCNEYLGDRSLTADQIASISAWVADGSREGDPNDVGAAIDVGDIIELTRVDKTLSLPGPYTARTVPDDYHCFVLDWNETTTKYVTGFRATPGTPSVVHHAIAFLAAPSDVPAIQALDDAEPGPGYTCFGGTGVNGTRWVGAWAPGSRGSDFPAGTGIKVDPGSKIVLQVHYNSLTSGVAPDETSIDFKLDDTVAKEARIQPWANPQWISVKDSMKIPAMEADVTHGFAYDASLIAKSHPFVVYAAGLHMHLLGTKARLEIERANGDKECLLQIDAWNFHWQGSYGLKTPTVFNPGDKMSVVCHWDNTPPKQPVIDGEQQPPHDVFWGEGTTDEMCLGSFYMTSM